jgi:outer membrane lipoprotein-sorting protein
MKNALLLCCILFTLAGCAQMEAPEFRQDGISQKQHDLDRYRCEVNARNTLGSMCQQMGVFVRCMTAKGYNTVPGTGNKGTCGDIF